MKILRFLLLLLPLLTSCSILGFGDKEDELAIIEEEDNAPVAINQEAIPTFEEKEEVKPETVEAPKRKFGFRTPDLVEDLPEEDELNKKPSFETSKIDDTVDEVTTIRATE